MRAISGLDQEGFRAGAARAEWTPAEVLSHVKEAEALLMEQALNAPAGEDALDVSISGKQRQERERQADSMPVPQIIHGLLAQRRDTLRALEHLSSARRTPRRTRTGLGPSKGSERDVALLFQRAAEHEEEHAAQISALRSQPGATT